MFICDEEVEGARPVDGLCVCSNENNDIEVFLASNRLARQGSLLFLFESLAKSGYKREDVIKLVHSSFNQVEGMK